MKILKQYVVAVKSSSPSSESIIVFMLRSDFPQAVLSQRLSTVKILSLPLLVKCRTYLQVTLAQELPINTLRTAAHLVFPSSLLFFTGARSASRSDGSPSLL